MAVSIFLLIIANLAWLYAYLALMFPQQQWISWLPLSESFIPRDYVAHALLIAFASQLMLLVAIYVMSARGESLRRRYKKARSAHKELKAERKDLQESEENLSEENEQLRSRVEKLEQKSQAEQKPLLDTAKDVFQGFLGKFKR